LNWKATIIAVLALLSVESFAQLPTANFSSDITSGCAPIIVNFKDLSSGASKWSWDFGNGATSSRQNPSTTFITPGTYNITLTVTNASGSNTIVKNGYITVYNEPTAAFVADRTTGCSPVPVQFTDQSVPAAGTTITGWNWDFGDGVGTSNVRNPRYVYKATGSYSVTLTISNDKGCTKLITKPNYINVTPGVAPSFSFSDPNVCKAPASVYFTNQSAGPGTLTYSWNFGNGNTSTQKEPTNLYNANGTYSVNLTVTSSQGCQDSMVRTVEIGKVNSDFIVPSTICPKTVVTFTNTSTPRPIKTLWQFPGGGTDTLKNGQTSFPSGGTYNVTVINTYSVCKDTLTKQVTVLPPPSINFKASDSGKCQPSLTVNFTNNTGGVSYTWLFGDSATSNAANPSHTYNSYGSFDVSLIATGTNGCVDTLKKPAYINIKKPVISFPGFPKNGCVPFTVNFAAQVQSVDSVVSYLWNFGDSSATSSQAQPTHTYNNPGDHDVTLTITTSSGCTVTYTLPKAVRSGLKPTAAFTSNITSACANPGIQFINQSIGATEYKWEFSDGSTSTLKDPLQTFLDTGWISVTLFAINNGCEDKTTKTKYAYIRPSVSRFDYKPDCSNNLKYIFIDRSIGAQTWSWNFGDGSTYSGQNPPAHTYATAGAYSVSLTTTSGSCSYTLTRTFTIVDLTPDFTMSPNNFCPGSTANFTATSPDPGIIKSYVWDYGDGNPPQTVGGPSVGHFYNYAGSFTVSLSTIDSFGCTHGISKADYAQVNGVRPYFSSLNNSGCKGMTVNFIDSTKTYGTTIVSWKWDFGDSVSQTYSSPPFNHRYDSLGDYDVKLTVVDSKGCRDSITRRAFVKVSTIKARWNIIDQACPGSQLIFYNQTNNDVPFSSLWDFGDNTTDTNWQVGHRYTDTGYYRVQLKVTDIYGCQDSLAKDSIVHVALPKADFTANNFISYCTPFQAHFTSTSYWAGLYDWDMAVATSTQRDPNVYYTSTGTYQVKLVVTSPGGCKDSITKQVTVYNPSDATLSYSPINGCTPRQVNFDAFSPMNAQFIWDFGDGNVTDTSLNQLSHTYVDYGNFTPVVILKEPSGMCTVALQGDSIIKMIGAKLKYLIDSSFFCDSGTISILDSSTTNDQPMTYNWDFGDGGTSTGNQPSHLYQTPGSYMVNLIVSTQNGCTDSLKKGPVKISMTPVLNVYPDSMICVNGRVDYAGNLINPDSSAVSWLWKFPNGSTSINQNPGSQTYTTPGSFPWSVKVTNSSGCSDSTGGTIIVNPLPTITLPSTITKFVGVPLTIPAKYSPGTTKYTWDPSNTLSCNDCPQPVTETKFNTKYSVIATDSNGCSARADVQVIVLCKGAKVFIPNTFSPNHDGTNDIFYVRGTGLDRVKSLRVFNRWGEVVFEQRDFPSNNEMYGWNGTYKGRTAQPGVYIYQVEIYCENGEVIHFEGNLSLIQ
jgi:gliding motility-associated-like protein